MIFLSNDLDHLPTPGYRLPLDSKISKFGKFVRKKENFQKEAFSSIIIFMYSKTCSNIERSFGSPIFLIFDN